MNTNEVHQPRREVRELRPADAPVLEEFFLVLREDPLTIRNFHPHELNATAARSIASYGGPDVYFGCFYSQKLAGYAMLRGWDEGHEMPSFGVAVHPGYRHRGIGRLLLHHAIGLAIDRGANKLMLKVHPENAQALEWYLDEGFRVVETLPDGQFRCELILPSATKT